MHIWPQEQSSERKEIVDWFRKLRYYDIDPTGLLESTDPHTCHCSLDLSIGEKRYLVTIGSMAEAVERRDLNMNDKEKKTIKSHLKEVKLSPLYF